MSCNADDRCASGQGEWDESKAKCRNGATVRMIVVVLSRVGLEGRNSATNQQWSRKSGCEQGEDTKRTIVRHDDEIQVVSTKLRRVARSGSGTATEKSWAFTLISLRSYCVELSTSPRQQPNDHRGAIAKPRVCSQHLAPSTCRMSPIGTKRGPRTAM
jgi:hypothetical protein